MTLVVVLSTQISIVICVDVKYNDYTTLVEKASAASSRFSILSTTIKDAEKRLGEIADVKKHIFNYSKTREVYANYRKAGYSKKFYEEHREAITSYFSPPPDRPKT